MSGTQENVKDDNAPEPEEEIEREEQIGEGEEQTEEQKKENKVQARMDQMTREKWDARRQAQAEKDRADAAERRARELEERLASATRDPNAPKDEKPPVAGKTPEETDREVQTRAELLRQQEKFDEKCNTIYADGKKEFKNWDETLGRFNVFGGVSPVVLQAITNLDNPHRVLHHLANNEMEYEDLVKMEPIRLAVTLAKLDERVKPQPAPKPRPVEGAGKPELRGRSAPPPPSPDKLPIDQWMKQRDEEVAKRRQR